MKKLSEKSKYYIPFNRQKELEYFCKQYFEFMSDMEDLLMARYSKEFDPTGNTACRLAIVEKKISDIDECLLLADEMLVYYLRESIVKGMSWNYISAYEGCPCSKGTFYDRRRKFFWLLDKKRG